MIFSLKTLIIAAILFAASMTIVGSMYLPMFGGENGFQAMESTFNSLRKGVRPPFDKLEKANEDYLGKNFMTSLVFSDNEKARTATIMFLANKLTVAPKGKSVNVQGDLGYTIKFFMDDIHLLYMNRFDLLEQKYSMPAMQSMYMLDRILKKLAVSLASQNMKPQERLVQDVRSKLLIPAYNLRGALPIGETSGFIYLALGTFGILLFAILWDISNYIFFGTLVSDGFMKPIRIALGRELSDEQKAELQKKQELQAKKKKMLEEAKAARAKKQAEELVHARLEGVRTNKEAMKKESSQPDKKSPQTEGEPGKQKPDNEKAALKKQPQQKKRVAPKHPADTRNQQPDESSKNPIPQKGLKKPQQPAEKKALKNGDVPIRKKAAPPETQKPAAQQKAVEPVKPAVQKQPPQPQQRKRKPTPAPDAAAGATSERKPQQGAEAGTRKKMAAPPQQENQQRKKIRKNPAPDASQKDVKKVTTRQGEQTAKAAPDNGIKPTRRPEQQAVKKPAPKKPEAKPEDKS
ncbi:hypothetical protein [Maridesulfovibrio sp. FT414]|uniref:hypothetical protein n=1 Tax=Maridesulfovibrio sp. FT414 TaxID=2979469 RepID=UPI003D8046C4